MRADIHDGSEHTLQSEAGYIDARPHQPESRKPLAPHGRTIHSGQNEKPPFSDLCQLPPAADITPQMLTPLGANNRREQVQLIGAEAGRPRTRTRSVWSTPQGPLGCPKLRWHQLCVRRDSSGARAQSHDRVSLGRLTHRPFAGAGRRDSRSRPTRASVVLRCAEAELSPCDLTLRPR